MYISNLSIEKLFNLYDYQIEFGIGNSLSVLTGPNGYGKTTILTILEELANGYLLYFYNLPFKNIKITFSDNSIIEISSKKEVVKNEEEDRLITSENIVDFHWLNKNKELSFFRLDSRLLRNAARRTVGIRRLGHSTTDFHERECIGNYIHNSDFYEAIALELNQSQFLMKLNEISLTFISANRIYFDRFTESNDNESPIKKISTKMMHIMEDARFNYLVGSQQSVAALTRKILGSRESLSENDYNKKKKRLEGLINRLSDYNLVNSHAIEPYQGGEWPNKILTAYIVELEKQISQYDTILAKLDLFKELINEKHFADKKIELSPDFGIRLRSNYENEIIDLDDLSSGEKNEIVMLFEMIFMINDKSILLIDEPENSLHVAWQRLFIQDLEEIQKTKEMQVIIATHSPRITARAEGNVTDLFYLLKAKHDK